MNKTFEFFSDMLNQMLTVEIDIRATKDESWVKSIDLYNETGDFVSKGELSPDEFRLINSMADEIAQDQGANAYEASLGHDADHRYDEMREMSSFQDAQTLMNTPDGYMVSDENE